MVHLSTCSSVLVVINFTVQNGELSNHNSSLRPTKLPKRINKDRLLK